MMQSFPLGNELECLKGELSEQPYPLLFATVSGVLFTPAQEKWLRSRATLFTAGYPYYSCP
jgi:hypothetical protein